MAKGLLYFAQNSAFQHLTKIGKTIKLDVEDRGLSASNVPENFIYLAIFECDDVDWAEKKVHEQFKGYRHHTQSLPKRKTEFFWSGCIEQAICYARDLKGVHDKTTDETEEIEIVGDNGQKQTARTPRTTFEMIGLPVGTEIFFNNKKDSKAVVSDKINQIEFNGKKGTISSVANKMLNYHVNGFLYFYHNGQRLFDLRPDQQDKE